MPIVKDGQGNIVQTAPDRADLFAQTGVAHNGNFAVCDKRDVLKQIKLDPSAQATNTTTTIASGATTGDVVITLPATSGTLVTSTSETSSFTTMQTPHGTSPVAVTSSDTLTFTSSDNTVTITGNSGTDTINFQAAAAGANTALSNLASTAVNADITPATNGVLNLGSTSNQFGTLNVTTVQSSSSLTFNSASTTQLNSLAGSYILLSSGGFVTMHSSAGAAMTVDTGGNVNVVATGSGAVTVSGGPLNLYGASSGFVSLTPSATSSTLAVSSPIVGTNGTKGAFQFSDGGTHIFGWGQASGSATFQVDGVDIFGYSPNGNTFFNNMVNLKVGNSAIAPNLIFNNDFSTGFWHPGSGQIGVSSSGTNVATFSSTGLTLAGALGVKGSSTGTVTVAAQAAAGTFNFNLPITAGTSGQVLTSGGGGASAMTWTTLGPTNSSGRYFSSTTTISGSLATVKYATQGFDATSSYNASTGVWTCQTTGKYLFNAAIATAGTVSLNSALDIQIQQSGSASQVSETLVDGAAGLTNLSASVSDIFNCVAGDTIVVQVSSGASAPTIVSSNSRNYLSWTYVGV